MRLRAFREDYDEGHRESSSAMRWRECGLTAFSWRAITTALEPPVSTVTGVFLI
jgi:hypothetical protein